MLTQQILGEQKFYIVKMDQYKHLLYQPKPSKTSPDFAQKRKYYETSEVGAANLRWADDVNVALQKLHMLKHKYKERSGVGPENIRWADNFKVLLKNNAKQHIIRKQLIWAANFGWADNFMLLLKNNAKITYMRKHLVSEQQILVEQTMWMSAQDGRFSLQAEVCSHAPSPVQPGERILG